MEKISKQEFVLRLRSYVIEQLTLLSEEEKPRGLRQNINFNKEKAREFEELLSSQGITIE